jgi:ubiquinol-cytochrome c reductase cytochrome b subunit
MLMSILVLMFLPFFRSSSIRAASFRPIYSKVYWFFVFNFIFLTWLGGKPATDLFVATAQISSLFYFSYFLIFIPFGGLLETRLLLSSYATKSSKKRY